MIFSQAINLAMKIVECVPNFSNGRDEDVLDSIISSISSVPSVKILNREMDYDHNRSVVTFIVEYDHAVEAAFRGIETASKLIDMNKHRGEHPRFGATDVVPFVPVSGCSLEDCSVLARELGERVGSQLNIPVYLYGEAANRPERKALEKIRNKNFQYEQLKDSITEDRWTPDFGPRSIGSAGATIIGSRDYLIAYNVYLNTDNMEIGKKIVRAVRGRSGGLTYVKALPFFISERNQVQISMNLTNFKKTPIYRVFEMIRIEARRFGVSITGSEIVGLIPLDAMLRSFEYYIGLEGFTKSQILEMNLLSSENEV